MISIRYGLKDFSGNRSTFNPKESDNSNSKPAKSKRLIPSLNSTIMSKSLSGVASPLIYEPKIEFFFFILAPQSFRNEITFSSRSLVNSKLFLILIYPVNILPIFLFLIYISIINSNYLIQYSVLFFF